MINRFRSNYDSEFDFEQDRDLIVLVNEASDPGTISSVTAMAQARFHARRQERRSRAGAQRQRVGHLSILRVAKPRI